MKKKLKKRKTWKIKSTNNFKEKIRQFKIALLNKIFISIMKLCAKKYFLNLRLILKH
jgi:hypothetical protein